MAQPYAQQIPQDVVSGEQYRYALQNFRIAHEKVEQQRLQMEEQEKQVASLKARIATLEGKEELNNGMRLGQKQGGTSVDDWSIKNTASKLEKLINRWAGDVVRGPPAPLHEIYAAALSDVTGSDDVQVDASPMIVQNILRHCMAETISEGVINCLIVTSSSETNVQLTRIHEHLFARDPTVACVWRRQTFSAAVENCSPDMSQYILSDNMPSLSQILAPDGRINEPCNAILDAAYNFSRMLHGSKSSSGGAADTFYRAFVPELGSVLYPRQVELIKRCVRSENGQPCQVGSTVFPGLVKVSKGLPPADGKLAELTQTVVRRAQVVCECALASGQGSMTYPSTPSIMSGYAQSEAGSYMGNGY